MSDFSDILAGAPPVEPAAIEPAPKRRGIRRLVLVFLALATVGAAGVGVKQATAEENHTMIGGFSLNDTPDGDDLKTSIFSIDGVCEGTGGYSDISSNTQVMVTDQDGNALAVTHLGEGKPGDSTFTHKNTAFVESCSFAWAAPDLPKRDFYNIQVGRRGELTYSYQQMDDNGWLVSGSIGD